MASPDVAPGSVDAWTPSAQRTELRRDRRGDRRGGPATAERHPEAPYVPFAQQYSPMRSLHPMRLPGSPNTVAIWILAFLPLIVVPVELAGYVTGIISTPAGYITLAIAVYASTIALALDDRAALRKRNLDPASGWWLLLWPPIAYLIARRVVLKSMGVKSNAPSNVYVLSLVAATVLLTVVLEPVAAVLASISRHGA